ncbi:MAG: hypothetical protein OES99_02795 [Gammaproteobacteria bacterium]|nr:hypothetical protein [Gammaproteobacteria bacterium]
MEVLLALIVIAFALPLVMFASPILLFIVPLIVVGLVVSYIVRGSSHRGRLWHWKDRTG